MGSSKAVKIGIDILKFVGNVVMDTADIGDYRVTVILERKIDNKQGLVIDNISVDKRMNRLQAEVTMRNIKEILNKS